MNSSIVPHSGLTATELAVANASVAATDPEEAERRWKEAEDLEQKLNFIQEHVPTRIQNVCGSSAGAGSGDFHQYRMVRRHEQMRLKRIDEEWGKQKEQEEFIKKRQQHELEAAERTAKKRAKRQKKKEKKKTPGSSAEPHQTGNGSEDDGKPEQPDLD